MKALITFLEVWLYSFVWICAAWASDPADQLKALPNVAVAYYELHSQSYRDLREEMHQKGPVDIKKRPRDAYTHWEVKWRWPFNKDGKAVLKETTTECSITVTLPRWIAPPTASPEELLKWKEYYAAIVVHERGHVDNVLENYTRIADSIRAAAENNAALKTTEANEIGNGILEELRKFDLDYDRDTEHGNTQGVVFR